MLFFSCQLVNGLGVSEPRPASAYDTPFMSHFSDCVKATCVKYLGNCEAMRPCDWTYRCATARAAAICLDEARAAANEGVDEVKKGAKKTDRPAAHCETEISGGLDPIRDCEDGGKSNTTSVTSTPETSLTQQQLFWKCVVSCSQGGLGEGRSGFGTSEKDEMLKGLKSFWKTRNQKFEQSQREILWKKKAKVQRRKLDSVVRDRVFDDAVKALRSSLVAHDRIIFRDLADHESSLAVLADGKLKEIRQRPPVHMAEPSRTADEFRVAMKEMESSIQAISDRIQAKVKVLLQRRGE